MPASRAGPTRRDFEAALQGLVLAERAATLVELAMVCHWLFDVPSMRRYASDALALGEELGRDDLVAGAMGALAIADSSDGELASSLERSERAFVRAGTQRPGELVPAAEVSSLILYWTGNYGEAVTRAQEAIELARSVNDTSNLIRALSDLGLALGASGRYAEALQTFDQARRFGQEYGIDTWTARAISMCGGVHLDVFDYPGAESLAEEARELGRSVNFLLPVVSGGIDLLLNFVRRGEVGRTDMLIDEVTLAADNAAGAHGWLWRLRLAQARAEIALARADWDAALRWASDALEQSVAHGRRKYEALARAARGQALSKSGRTRQGLVEVRAAVNVARTTGDPALFVRTAAQLLPHGIEEPLLAQVRAAVAQIANNLPDTCMRERFAAAKPVRLLGGPVARIVERLSS